MKYKLLRIVSKMHMLIMVSGLNLAPAGILPNGRYITALVEVDYTTCAPASTAK